VKHFLAHERERATAQKRGGGVRPLSLDVILAEDVYGAEPADQLSPDHLFDRRWAVTILERALARVRNEFAEAAKAAFFDALRPALTKEHDADCYAAIARDFEMSEGAVKGAVHRLRRRYRAALRSEIRQTVAHPDEVDAELRHLFEVLG
jgi:RNA polymerase sigma-70 factor (ECF subfamily)